VSESYPGANQRFSASSPLDPPLYRFATTFSVARVSRDKTWALLSLAQTDFTPDAERDLINIFLHGIEHFGPVQAASYTKTLPTPRSGWRRITVSLSRAFAGTSLFPCDLLPSRLRPLKVFERLSEIYDISTFLPIWSKTKSKINLRC